MTRAPSAWCRPPSPTSRRCSPDLAGERVEAAVFVGKFWKQRASTRSARRTRRAAASPAAGCPTRALGQMVVATLAGMGIEVLDQRAFLAPWMMAGGNPDRARPRRPRVGRDPRGLPARRGAWRRTGSGRRSCARAASRWPSRRPRAPTRPSAAGAGSPGRARWWSRRSAAAHDYRFDIPTVGTATIAAMREGGATALAVTAGRCCSWTATRWSGSRTGPGSPW